MFLKLEESTNYKIPTTILSRSKKAQKESVDGFETLEATHKFIEVSGQVFNKAPNSFECLLK